jgi:hypothetical protein
MNKTKLSKHKQKQRPRPAPSKSAATSSTPTKVSFRPEAFMSAGRKAYAMIIPFDGCIYTNPSQKNAWIAGYRDAERKSSYGTMRHAKARPQAASR